MHRGIANQLGPRTALRFKRYGLYSNLSWTAYRWQADMAAAGLIDLGVQKGDRIAILSENRYEWLIADHAMLSAGAVTVPLHAPLSPKQVEYQVGHSEAKGIFVSNQQQADKVFAVLDALPKLEFLVSFDKIESPLNSIRSMTWEGLKHRGTLAGEAVQAEIAKREASLTEDDLATIIYTSGTTGNPKGVMLSHGNLLSNCIATIGISAMEPNDVQLSWLPYSHIYARNCDHYITTLAKMTVALAESIETLIVNLRETQPTWMTAVPRFYEKVWSSVEHLPPAERASELRKIFGPRIKQLSSGGAPLPRHVCDGFHGAGLPLLEGYGLTESSPVISFNSAENCRIGSVGRAIPGVEVKIADDGEILTRGPHVMKGYWRNPEATAETIRDGWLHTGDVGHLDDEGYLHITDRKKDLIITSGGKNIAPSEIERLLVSDVFIDQAVVYGDGRPFICALVVPNFENLAAKARELGSKMQADGRFINCPKIGAFYEGRIKELMQAVSQPERVKKFLVLASPFKLESDELTATMKVRRRHVVQNYLQELSALYESETAVAADVDAG
jgi:long-chain acyl-CoA synthetase